MRLYDLSRKTHIYEAKLKSFLIDGAVIDERSIVQIGAVFKGFGGEINTEEKAAKGDEHIEKYLHALDDLSKSKDGHVAQYMLIRTHKINPLTFSY